jgi:hypothetical protein
MKPELKYSILACALAQAFSINAHAQTSDQPIAEVVVTGARAGLERAAVGGFGDTPIVDTPASITAIGRTRMQDLSIRSTTEAMRYDASVSDAYNAVGYAEQFSIRGFALDNNYSYRKDGFAIPGDTQIPLENKERRPRRPLRRPPLRLPHQRGGRGPAFLRARRKRRPPVRVRRLRLADHPGRAAAARPRLPAQGADHGAGLPADPQ